MNRSRPFPVLVLVTAVALTAVTWGASEGPASAARGDVAANSIGLRLLGEPGRPDDQRARLYVVDHAAPGTSLVRRVEVSNTTPSPARVALYSAGATIADGSFVGAADRTPNELSSWTSLAPSEVEVASGGVAQATVTITVPADAAPGEQYGVVWAQVSASPVAGSGITQVSRVGLRLYVSVGPGGAPAADFRIESMTADRMPDGRPMVLASVRNTGGRALDLSGTLDLSNGPGGLRAGPFPVDVGVTLAIGAVEPVRVVLDGQVPDGPWSARLLLRSGFVERTADGAMTFPADAPPSTGMSAWIWIVAGLLLALLVAGVVVWARRRRVLREPATQPR